MNVKYFEIIKLFFVTISKIQSYTLSPKTGSVAFNSQLKDAVNPFFGTILWPCIGIDIFEYYGGDYWWSNTFIETANAINTSCAQIRINQ